MFIFFIISRYKQSIFYFLLLWHVDTNQILVRWNFIIVSGINGFSRLPAMLKCTDTNNENTLLMCFLEAVSTYGLPSRVQAHQGLENVKISDYMISRGGINRGSAITGKSTHSQRTECFCKDVVVLHHVFLHKIQEKLDMWNRVWSQHRLRTARSSPTRM